MVLKKAISIFLSFLLLASNVGFAINTHFCGGKAVKTTFSLGIHNPNCGMEEDETCSFQASNKTQLQSKPCCLNQHQLLHIDDAGKLKSLSIHINTYPIPAFLPTFFQPFLMLKQNNLLSLNFLHSLPDKDRKVLFQSFLI